MDATYLGRLRSATGRRSLKLVLAASAAAVLMAQAGRSDAQTQPAAPSSAAGAASQTTGPAGQQDSSAVPTIVVTAEKRSENIQSVPLSVSAFSGAQLKALQVEDFSDLSEIAPGAIYSSGHRDTDTVEMRGSTTASTAPAVDSGVSIYVDDVPTIGVQELNQNFFDLDRIEVLRGPQGELFGRNVTGGLISIHTLNPQFTPDLRVSAELGNYDGYQVSGYLTGPITNTLAGSLSVNASGHDGYQRDVVAGGTFGQTDDISGRAKLLFEPTQDLTITLSGDFYHERGSAGSAQLLGIVQPDTVLPKYPVLCYSPTCTNLAVKGTAGVDNYSLAAHVDWKTPIGTLTSITAWRAVVNREYNQANAGDPLGDFQEFRDEPDSQFTEEARLTSNSDQRLRWQIGAFYLNGESKQDFPVEWNYSAFPVCSATAEPAFGFFVSLFNGCTSNIEIGDFSQHVRLVDAALFGDVEFDLLPNLTASIGGRQSWETRSGYNHYSELNIIFGPPANVPFKGTTNQFTPKFDLKFTPVPGFMVYGTISEGFKGQGFDIFSGAFPEETTWNYEAGIKSEWFDRRVVLNASVFDQLYHDLQLRDFNPATGLFVTGTVSRATVEGVEVELSARPVEWLSFGGSWSYQDPKQGTGLQLQFSPQNAVNLYAEAKWPVPSIGGTVAIGGDVTYKSAYWSTNANNDPAFFHSRTAENGLVNLHADWTSDNRQWEVSVWGKNVGDVRYVTFGGDVGEPYFFPAAVPGHLFDVYWNDPATYGVTLTYHMR